MIALAHAVQKGDKVVPTIGGLLLFGSKSALRRTMPMAARIDYILVEGTEWVKNPLERYISIEYREALITVISRLHAQIMSDLPTRFQLKTGDLQRSDIPSIPRDVIREALANALMHRDYRVDQAVQIIRYSNRIEFHNPGYSLKPFDELGQSGSLTRNAKIAAVFHDLKFAETKGTGITTMKLLTMKGSGSETYYQLVPQITGNGDTAASGNPEGTPYTSSSPEELTSYLNPLHKGLDAIPKGFPNLPDNLKNKIIHLKRRSSKKEVEDIIITLCSLGPLQPVQMGKILERDPQYLRIKFLSEMTKTGKLVYRYPNKPAHPQQAYKTPEPILGGKSEERND